MVDTRSRRGAGRWWVAAVSAGALAGLLPAGAGHAGALPPAPPGTVAVVARTGGIEVQWLPSPSSAGSVDGYEIAPVVGGAPCPSCAHATRVAGRATAVTFPERGLVSTTFAVRAVGGGG